VNTLLHKINEIELLKYILLSKEQSNFFEYFNEIDILDSKEINT
jgi:hypothetical protein